MPGLFWIGTSPTTPKKKNNEGVDEKEINLSEKEKSTSNKTENAKSSKKSPKVKTNVGEKDSTTGKVGEKNKTTGSAPERPLDKKQHAVLTFPPFPENVRLSCEDKCG